MKLEINCPRCAGHGHRTEWHPDNGVCYRCGGKKIVQVDPVALFKALRYLRVKYSKLLRERASSVTMELLTYTEADGRRVRETLAEIHRDYPEYNEIDWNEVENGRVVRGR